MMAAIALAHFIIFNSSWIYKHWSAITHIGITRLIMRWGVRIVSGCAPVGGGLRWYWRVGRCVFVLCVRVWCRHIMQVRQDVKWRQLSRVSARVIETAQARGSPLRRRALRARPA